MLRRDLSLSRVTAEDRVHDRLVAAKAPAFGSKHSRRLQRGGHRHCRFYARSAPSEYEVLDLCFEDVDYLSLHMYFRDRLDGCLEFQANVEVMDRFIKDAHGRRHRRGDPAGRVLEPSRARKGPRMTRSQRIRR